MRRAAAPNSSSSFRRLVERDTGAEGEPVANVLVIDDNETLREGVATVCERMGHHVRSAASGEDGINLLKGTSIDLVLTDLKMDGLDGIGVLKAVKAHDVTIAVMIITAYATIQTAVEAIKLGAYDYIE